MKVGGTDSREGRRRTEIQTSFVGHWVMPPSQNIAAVGTEAQPLKIKTTQGHPGEYSVAAAGAPAGRRDGRVYS